MLSVICRVNVYMKILPLNYDDLCDRGVVFQWDVSAEGVSGAKM